MSLFDLKGRVALVTGGNGGIGLGWPGLAAAGAAVAVAGRNKASRSGGQELKLGAKTVVLEADVADGRPAAGRECR